MTNGGPRTQLRDAVLRAADLGPDYEESGSTNSPLVMYEMIMHHIQRQVTDEVIMISFSPASHGTPRQAAIATTYWAWNPKNPDRPDIGEDDPPPFGDEGVAFRWRHEQTETMRNGHLAAWRYGDVVVNVTVQGRGYPNVLGYALRQHEKLRATFPTPPTFHRDDEDEVDPIVRVECPESHPIRGVLLDDGTRIYLRPMDAAYDDATPVRCFNTDAAAERAGYHRRPDEASRWETSSAR